MSERERKTSIKFNKVNIMMYCLVESEAEKKTDDVVVTKKMEKLILKLYR